MKTSGFFQRLGQSIQRFMAGRYGTDKLNLSILLTGVATSILSSLMPRVGVKLILLFLSYILLFLAIFRTFSRNTYRRYEENRKFLMFFQRLRDRDHRYFYCPRCRQQVRVPRGKGTIAITCPKCREKFVKKT